MCLASFGSEVEVCCTSPNAVVSLDVKAEEATATVTLLSASSHVVLFFGLFFDPRCQPKRGDTSEQVTWPFRVHSVSHCANAFLCICTVAAGVYTLPVATDLI